MKTSWELYESVVGAIDESSRQFSRMQKPQWMKLGSAQRVERQTLSRRAAHKYFNDRYMSSAFFDNLDAKVQMLDAKLWPSASQTAPLRTFVYASRVDGMRNGLHALSGEGADHLSSIRGLSPDELVLQPEFSDAAAIVIFVGSLRASTAFPHGEHGYRLLLERAGAAAETVWLEALREGYDASIFAGLLPAVLRQVVGMNGFDQTQLVALAVGYSDAERVRTDGKSSMV